MKEDIRELIKRTKEDMLKIANFSLWEKLTVRNSGVSRGTIQRAYKEMKHWALFGKPFNGDVIDYLCYEALEKIFEEVILANLTIRSYKKFCIYIEGYIEVNKHVTIPAIRLLLKNENYFDVALKNHLIHSDDKRFIMLRKLLDQKIQTLMNLQLDAKLKKNYKSNKLKRG